MASFLAVFFPIDIDEKPAHAYYLPHLRFGELLIGSIFAIYVQSKGYKNELLERKNKYLWIGSLSTLALLLCLVLPFPHKTPLFPGFMAVIPCLASVGIIYCGQEKSNILTRFLSSSTMVFIGKISYSLYLWHWVVLSFANYYLCTKMLWWQSLALIPIMFILSYASYKLIEQPLRYKNYNFKITFFSYYLMPSAICFAIMLLWKPSVDMSPYCVLGKPNIPGSKFVNLPIGNSKNQPKVLIAGDSYTIQLIGFMEEVSKYEGWNGILSGLPANIFILNYIKPKLLAQKGSELERVKNRNKNLIAKLPSFDTIILSNCWINYLEDKNFIHELEKALYTLEKQGKKIILINSCHTFAFSRLQETYWNLSGYKTFKDNRFTIEQIKGKSYAIERHNVDSMMQAINRSCPNIKYIDLTQYIPKHLMVDGKTVLSNNSHINYWGSKEIAKRFIRSGNTLVTSNP